MDASVVGGIVFGCAFLGALLGMFLRNILPGRYFDAESRDTVRVGIGLITTMTALVLGLVTARRQGRSVRVCGTPLGTASSRFGRETGPTP